MCNQQAVISLSWPLFGPCRTTFGTFRVLQMAQTGLSGCLFWCSNLVPPLPAQNRPSGAICVAKRLLLAYLGPFLAPVGSHLGHSGSGKWAKLINLDVLSVVPTSFKPVQLNRGSQMAIILNMLILSFLLAFLGRFEGLNMRNALTSSWNGVSAYSGTRKNH